LNYKTGAAVKDFDASVDGFERSMALGGGIPSKPVTVITDTDQKLLISIGSTNPESSSCSIEAGIVGMNPLSPTINFFYLWWQEL